MARYCQLLSLVLRQSCRRGGYGDHDGTHRGAHDGGMESGLSPALRLNLVQPSSSVRLHPRH